MSGYRRERVWLILFLLLSLGLCEVKLSDLDYSSSPFPIPVFLTFTAMQSRSDCSRAAQPCAVCPEDAQQPVVPSVSCLPPETRRCCMVSSESPFYELEDQHTQHCGHHTQTRVRICLVGLSYAQLGERRQFGRSGGARELVCGVLTGDHDCGW